MKNSIEILMLLATLFTSLTPGFACSRPVATSTGNMAAIIDQLTPLGPNPGFIDETTKTLRDYGLEVDLYQGKQVTADLYRKLPASGYKIIVFRVHSGALRGEDSAERMERTYLLTNEVYSKTRYVSEQLDDQMAVTRVSEAEPYVFAIGSGFVTKSMEGKFANTVIIMMGCTTIRFTDMVSAFIDKGASAYIGWDASIELSYVDKATRSLIRNLCTNGLNVGQAIVATRNETGSDPVSHARLLCYPDSCASRTLAQLTR